MDHYMRGKRREKLAGVCRFAEICRLLLGSSSRGFSFLLGEVGWGRLLREQWSCSVGGGRGWERTDSRNQGKLWRSEVMSEKLLEGSVVSGSEGRKSQACGFREVITWCDRVKGVSPSAGF